MVVNGESELADVAGHIGKSNGCLVGCQRKPSSGIAQSERPILHPKEKCAVWLERRSLSS